jgi:hypothetical protein
MQLLGTLFTRYQGVRGGSSLGIRKVVGGARAASVSCLLQTCSDGSCWFTECRFTKGLIAFY